MVCACCQAPHRSVWHGCDQVPGPVRRLPPGLGKSYVDGGIVNVYVLVYLQLSLCLPYVSTGAHVCMFVQVCLLMYVQVVLKV